VLARLETRHQPVRDEYVHVRAPRRGNGTRTKYRSVRDERYPDVGVADIFVMVLDIEAVDGDRVHQVRVFKGRGRRAQARCLVVACCDQVGDVLSCNSKCLFQEADDHMRRRTHRIEDVTGVNDQVHIALQDGVHSPPVSLLDIDLTLVAAGVLMELRVPTVSQMSIRDVGYADYVSMIPSIWRPTLF
jgi:hypothetical protein